MGVPEGETVNCKEEREKADIARINELLRLAQLGDAEAQYQAGILFVRYRNLNLIAMNLAQKNFLLSLSRKEDSSLHW